MKDISTDWHSYYNQRIPRYTRITRYINNQLILKRISEFTKNSQGISIAELGGGNSCIADSLISRFSPRKYWIVEKCKLGMELLSKNIRFDFCVVPGDVLNRNIVSHIYADLTISLGLIEHFDKDGTKLAIDNHFLATKSGGLVVMTYPTTTVLYRLTRSVAQKVGAWHFPDERALSMSEVQNICKEYGDILLHKINWKNPLTQAQIYIRKR